MQLVCFSFICFLFLPLLSARDVVKRTLTYPVLKQKRLSNSFNSIQLSSYNLVICGLLCTESERCIASSLNISSFMCALYDDQSGSEFVNNDTTLIYQKQGESTTTNSQDMSTVYTNVDTSGLVTMPITPHAAPLAWPIGSYTLMKPSVGCPGNGVDWKEGSRYHDTENNQTSSRGYVISTNMSVIQEENKNIRVYFCTKDTPTENESDWPAGNYCILKHGEVCPDGFEDGFLRWDDENDENVNSFEGTLPSGVYDADTMIDYCCRDDESAATPIYLPASHPFYLLRYTSTCQSVYSMFVSEETIEWDCQDDSIGFAGFVHPFEDGSENNIKLHFCYYYI